MLQEAEVSVLLQEKGLGQEEQLPADLATEVLLVSGRKKEEKKEKNKKIKKRKKKKKILWDILEQIYPDMKLVSSVWQVVLSAQEFICTNQKSSQSTY